MTRHVFLEPVRGLEQRLHEYVRAVEAALDAHDQAIGSLDVSGQPDMLPPGRVEMLLASLRHYCDEHGIDFANSVYRSRPLPKP